jgi:hypothetical protein
VNPNTPKTSPRLVRAATAERRELSRHRARLISRLDDLRAELDQVERALVEVDERSGLLDRLAPVELPEGVAPTGKERAVGSAGRVAEGPVAQILRGTAIRETAVRLLVRSSDAHRPIHYRHLYELLRDSGFEVAGKDPLATFLTQLSRSPVMHKTTQAGIYELDFDASERLRRRLTELQADLRTVTGNPGATDDLAEIRERREQVLAEMAQIERALEEAARVIAVPASDEANRGAA